MNTLIDTPKTAELSGDQIVVTMTSGESFSFPCSEYQRLASASQAERSEIELSPFGLHWPQLDEDLAVGPLRQRHANR